MADASLRRSIEEYLKAHYIPASEELSGMAADMAAPKKRRRPKFSLKASKRPRGSKEDAAGSSPKAAREDGAFRPDGMPEGSLSRPDAMNMAAESLPQFFAMKAEKAEEKAPSADKTEENPAPEEKAENVLYDWGLEEEELPAETGAFWAAREEREPAAFPSELSYGNGRKLEELLGELKETFSERLLRLIRERDLDEAEVYRKAFVDRRHFSKIRNDRNYQASKKTVLAFALALRLSLDEAKDLLNCAGYSLSGSSKYDVILQFFLENQIYDMFVINDVLYEYGQPIFE